MIGKDLFKRYTMLELLEQFSVNECFEQPDDRHRIGEMTNKQINLYT